MARLPYLFSKHQGLGLSVLDAQVSSGLTVSQRTTLLCILGKSQKLEQS